VLLQAKRRWQPPSFYYLVLPSIQHTNFPLLINARSMTIIFAIYHFLMMVSHNQDAYELSTPKHWRIIHHIYGLNKPLLHEFLSYKRNTYIMKCLSLKHSGSKIKILALGNIRACIGPMMRSPRLLLTGQAPKSPYSPRTRHWATPICYSSHNTEASLHTFNPQTKLEQLNLSKTGMSTWS
jgi:hypothetical protein